MRVRTCLLQGLTCSLVESVLRTRAVVIFLLLGISENEQMSLQSLKATGSHSNTINTNYSDKWSGVFIIEPIPHRPGSFPTSTHMFCRVTEFVPILFPPDSTLF